MPGKGYATVGMKPVITTRLQEATDKSYPGMFLPSTLIIIMNEIKKGYYSVDTHKIKLDLSGRYNTITIRADVKNWLEENHKKLGEEYEEKYSVKCFTKFVSYFIVNMLESKNDAQNHSISLKGTDFKWLHEEYQKQKKDLNDSNESPSFERFADTYINELLVKIKAAKEILTL
ncbi:MAG TPA: hypothetical protein OQH54_01125 [Nitrosopumilus sp.]|nr:hypothetical protein [Thermoproteota archaeon]HJJ22307.1 hypothetical protein [Nitrosopumilus sp.]